jgi:hypothetical protein
LFGDRLVANPTVWSSIYGGNLPTTPSSITRERTGFGVAKLLKIRESYKPAS